MEFRVLGPVEADAPIVGAKQRLFLSMLLAARGERVSRDAIADALWPVEPPADVAHALDLQASRLRKALGSQRLVTADGGYGLVIDEDAVDADRFSALVDEADGLPPAEAAARLRAALDIWRGPAFGDLGGEPALRPAAAGLDEQRLAATERWAELELELDRDVTAELERVGRAHLFREHLQGLRMLALYRDGRQADALAVYETLRRGLADELGIPPGDDVRALHERIVRQDPALRPRKPATVRRHRRIAASIAAVVVGAIVVAVAVVGEDGTSPLPAPGATIRLPVADHHLAFIDLRRGRLLATVPLQDESGALAQGSGSDWLVTESGTLMQIDPRGRRVTRTTSLGFEPGGQGLAVGLGGVWAVARDRPLLVRLDPAYGTIQRRYRLPVDGVRHGERLGGIAIAAGSVWVTQGEARVLRIDPRSGRVLARVPATGAVGVAGDTRAMWVAGGDQSVAYEIDPAANTVVARVPLDAGYQCCVAAGGGAAWALTQRVFKLSAQGVVQATIPIDGDGANLFFSGGALWVAEGISGRFTRVDPATNATRHLDTGGLALGAIVHGDIAVVVVGEAPRRLLAGVPRPVARVLVDTDRLQPDDPALPADEDDAVWRDAVLDATCAHLVAVDDGHRSTLVPEIADLPLIADGGRSWTFRIRPGWRFSPPSGAPVTAESMRQTIARAVDPRMGPGAPGPALLSDLAGVRAERDRLVVTLNRPAYDLAIRLAAPAFCAVPAGTPASATRFIDAAPPTAGPYYLAKHYGGLSALLRRNPGYGGTRARPFAAFLFDLYVQPVAAAERVRAGAGDLVLADAEALGRDSVPLEQPVMHALVLRTGAGPLADRRRRLAVMQALDRDALAPLLHDRPAEHVLPGGVGRTRAASGTAPEVSGVALSLRTCAGCPAFTAVVRRELGRAGFRVRTTDRAVADVSLRRARFDVLDPLAFVGAFADTPPPRHRAADVTARARRLAAKLERRAAVFPIGTPAVAALASPRLGCLPPRRLDLTTLCPR